MQLILHVKGFYEWIDVPDDVERDTPEWKRAVKAGKIKPMQHGRWAMHVPKEGETQTVIGVNEDDIIQVIIQEMTRGDRQHLTRVQAASRLVTRHTLHHHTHASNVQEVQVVQDDGPKEEMFRKVVGEHVACSNIDQLDFEPLLEAYMTPTAVEDFEDHLHTHFKIKPEKLNAFRAKREERETTMRAALEHHRARVAAQRREDAPDADEEKKEVTR